jgi:hypothetical protein
MSDFEATLKQQFREQENCLSPGVETRLRANRKNAVEIAAKGNSFASRVHRLLLPVTGMAMVSVFALVITLSPGTEDTSGNHTPDQAVSSQDLDFYYWLAETQNVNGT